MPKVIVGGMSGFCRLSLLYVLHIKQSIAILLSLCYIIDTQKSRKEVKEMIINKCGFVWFETEKDFKEAVSKCCGRLWYNGAIFSTDERFRQFPACFEYISSLDSRSGGFWYYCTDTKRMIQGLDGKGALK